MKFSSKKNVISITIGVLFVVFVATIQFLNPAPVSRALILLDNALYDLQLRYFPKPLPKDAPIVIVDIDNRSISEYGRWPWSRKTLALLTEKLHKLGAKVVAFDITFPEKEENIVEEVLSQIKQTPAEGAIKELESVKESFDYDAVFADSLRLGTSVLGFAFVRELESKGALPAPFLSVSPETARELLIPNMLTYIGNLPELQQAAVNGGFINSFADADGVIRSSPLLIRRETKVYPSLALEAARLYLSSRQDSFMFQSYKGVPILEGIQLDQYTVPVNPWGRILVPFRGGPFSFPYISSADVLNDRTPREAIANKLVFIGSSATAVGDLYPVAVSPVFPGIEVNASIAEGIIDGYLPYKPAWGKGVVFALVLVLGISCAVLLPSVGAIVTEVVCLTLTFGLLVLKWWLWVHYGMDIEVLLPIIVIQVVVALDMLTGYFFEARGRKETRQLFNQYVSSEYIDKMFETDREFVLKGENKELTALFSDIRGFTSISESLSAPEIKEILDSYLTPMTQILFDYRGTIDKYIGDAIMAFWGAPLEDPKHACDAVNAGLAMHAKLKEFNAKAREKKWPELHIGVGINTGFMHVGDMGSKFRRAYTVIGDAVNLASRLESLTKFYHVKILVGENTYNQSKDLFIYRKIDKIRVKGKTVPVVIYEPLCAVGEGNETMRAEIALHHLALEQYFQRDWKEAERIFNELRTSYPQNGALYALFLQRIQSTPLPGPDWDGSLTMEIK